VAARLAQPAVDPGASGYRDIHFSSGDIAAKNSGIDFMSINAQLGYRFSR
jgi:hypothetical protein